MKSVEKLRRVFTPRFLLLLLTLVAVTTAVGLWLYIRYDPTSSSICVTCHNMAPFVADISKTPHGNIPCAECHNIDFAKWLWVQIVENPTPQQIAQRYTASMYSQCLSCHTQQRLQTLNIHKAHGLLAAKLGDCTICHNPHKQEALSGNCMICHDLEKILGTHMAFHSYAWAQVDMGRFEVCQECHSPWAKWYVPIGPDCVIGVSKNVPCIGCHGPRAEPFNPAAFTDCTRCHSR